MENQGDPAATSPRTVPDCFARSPGAAPFECIASSRMAAVAPDAL